MANCPRCNSHNPTLHPAVQWEGEVQICPDPFHRSNDEGRRVLDRVSAARSVPGTTEGEMLAPTDDVAELDATVCVEGWFDQEGQSDG